MDTSPRLFKTKQAWRAWEIFENRPPSEKKLWGYWILSAKKPETRARRVAETVMRVLAGRRPGM